MAMNDQELKRFAAQNVEYGFSADVMPSTLGPRRAALAPLNVTTGSMAGSNGPQNGRFSAKNPDYRVYPKLRPQGPEYRRGPRAKPTAPVEEVAPGNPYANGGDGTVARASGPDRYNTNIAGGLSRDELIRRMEMASTTMRGSPSARAAVMGVYADQVKSLDQGELAKNQGNIEASQLQYKGDMDANMQEAAGRQAFGNDMGILNRKGELDADASAAAANDPYKLAQVENLKAQTQVRMAEAANKSAETEARLQLNRDSADNAREAMIAKQHPDWTAEQVRAEAQRVALGAGQANSGSTNMDFAKANTVNELIKAVNTPNTYSDQAMYLDDGQAHFFTDPTAAANVDTTAANFTMTDTEGFFPGLRRAFGGQTKTLTMRDADGKIRKQAMLRDKAQIETLDALLKAQAAADYKRRLGE